ncbi:MAG: SCO family protein [Polyangiaceae bacterium]
MTMLETILLSAALMLQPGPAMRFGDEPVARNDTPPELEGVGITERLGAEVPRDRGFTDHRGRTVTLGEVLAHDRPTILTFNYSDCPMLCSLQLNGLVTTMGQMGWTLGEQYDVVTLSIDPRETPERAAQTRDRYLEQLKEGREGLRITEDAWPFLVSDAGSVKAVAEAVGFGYRLNPDNGEWLHTATLVLLSPDDTVSRYLYGVSYSPQTLRLSLAEASDGVRVSTVDQAILYCFQYDAGSGSYTPVVANIMRLGGGLTALVVFAAILVAVLRRRLEDDATATEVT